MELLEKIYRAGVVGAGGAGFPTHKKLVKDAELLIVNAAECEPLLNSDRFVMRRFAGQIVDALVAIGEQLNIGKIIIGTKKKYHREITALEQAIAKRGADISIFGTGGFYPAGDEQVLIHEITGKTVPPGGIPIALGIVVVNVTTVLNIYDALRDRPVTRKFVTVTGEVAHPCILEVPVGTPVADCIKAAGGATREDYVVIKGGPMMGKQFDKSRLEELYITKTDGGIILLPKDHCLVRSADQKLEHIINQAKSVCMQCSYCTEMCPRYLIGHNMRPNRVMRSISTGVNVEDLTDALLCCECGICELHACPMRLSPRQVNIYVKGLLRQGGARVTDTTVHEKNKHMREYRQIAQSRLISHLDLRKYPTDLDELVGCQPEAVTIPLRQGIGRPSTPVVAEGDRVHAGDLIAQVAFSDVGSQIHASMDGVVAAVGEAITIARTEGETI